MIFPSVTNVVQLTSEDFLELAIKLVADVRRISSRRIVSSVFDKPLTQPASRNLISSLLIVDGAPPGEFKIRGRLLLVFWFCRHNHSLQLCQFSQSL